MLNPYKIAGPALISFSGGRTSAYMLFKILEAHQGNLPDDLYVTFANTGKERELRWRVHIHYLEYGIGEVDYFTASRNGEPFAALINKRGYLPNPLARLCTQELKIRVMRDFMTAFGYRRWDVVIGLRADEPRRVANARKPTKERWEKILPLAEDGVTLRDITAFWADNRQGFDLQLKSYEGNCDLCFLKGANKLVQIIREKPQRADWWIEQEICSRASKPNGALFRKDRPSYAKLKQIVEQEGNLFEFGKDDYLVDCFCTE